MSLICCAEVMCEKHKEEFTYFCPVHSQICCMTCVAQQHGKCKNVVTVEESAVAQRKLGKDKALMTDLNDLKAKYEVKTERQKRTAAHLTEQIENTRSKVHKFYDDIISKLTKAKATTLLQIDEYEIQNLPEIKQEISDAECKLSSLLHNLDCLHMASKLDSPLQYLYVIINLNEVKDSFENTLQANSVTNESVDMHFTPLDSLAEILESTDSLGGISIFRSNPGEEKADKNAKSYFAQMNMTHGQVINSSAKTDDSKAGDPITQSINFATVKPSLVKVLNVDAAITGLFLTDNSRMLISKEDSKSLAIIDTEGKELSSLKLHNYTCGIRMISQSKGAVVVRNKCLQFFNVTKDQLVKCESLNVLVRYDFTFLRDHFFIGGDNKIMVYNTSHRHVRDITVPGRVTYICARDDISLCYTVYWGRELYSITLDGSMVFMYSHKKLQRPSGVTVDTQGYIYVCGYDSKNIHQLSHDGKLERIILDVPATPFCFNFNTRGDKAVTGCRGKVLLYDFT